MFTAILVCLLGAIGMETGQAAQLNPRLTVSPSAGHAGDLFFLSGSGYRPHTKLTFIFGCPDAHSAGPNHLIVGQPGPVTDADGRFLSFPMRAIAPPVDGRMGCHLYATDNPATIEPGDPPRYTIYPLDDVLPTCATHICLTVRQRAEQWHGQAVVVITIKGWPGMDMHGTLQSAPGHLLAFTVSHSSSGVFIWRIPERVACGAMAGAKLQVQAVLYLYNGLYSGTFAPRC